MQDVYHRLAKHLEGLIMGYPFTEALIDLLMEMFSPVEAEVALAIPNNLAPLEVVGLESVASRSDLPKSTVAKALDYHRHFDSVCRGFCLWPLAEAGRRPALRRAEPLRRRPACCACVCCAHTLACTR